MQHTDGPQQIVLANVKNADGDDRRLRFTRTGDGLGIPAIAGRRRHVPDIKAPSRASRPAIRRR